MIVICGQNVLMVVWYLFLEDDFEEKKLGTQWFDEITAKFPHLEAYKVHYTTKINQLDYFLNNRQVWDRELNIIEQLPQSVRDEFWDVILIDAPLGCCNTGPGRYQSIYTFKFLWAKGGRIFLDNYERKVEREFSHAVFGTDRCIVHEEPGAAFKNMQIEFFNI